MKRTLYEVLGVDREASAEEIAAAYRKRIEELKGAPVQDQSALALARDAHDILSDTYLRAAYDASLARPAPAPPAAKEKKGEAETGHAHWLHQRKWAAAAVVLLVLATGWFALSRPSRMHTAPSRTATAQPAPAAVQEQSPGAATVVRSPKDVFNEVSPSVVRVNVLDASSRLIDAVSGVVIEPGVIITNCHVAVGGTTLSAKGR